MAEKLEQVLRRWVDHHPGGKYTFCLDAPSHQELTPHQAVDYFKRTLSGSDWESRSTVGIYSGIAYAVTVPPLALTSGR